MKIAIIGAGGVGGYFGAHLAAAGSDVTFIARGAHRAAMLEHGLTIESPVHPLRLKPVKVSDDPASVGPADLVLIAVKLWSTEDAVKSAKPLVGPATGVISFQNGVDAVDVISEHLGRSHAMGGVAHIAAVIDRPGVIRHNGSMARLTFGELDGSVSPRGEALLAACRAAGIEACLSQHIQEAIWEKFVFLAGLSGMTCLTRSPIGAIREDPVTRDMLRGVMGEVVAVARARKVNLPADIVDRQMAFADALPPDMISSMLGDLQRGNRLELDWLAGTVVRLAMDHAVPTPLNSAIYAALKLHANGQSK